MIPTVLKNTHRARHECREYDEFITGKPIFFHYCWNDKDCQEGFQGITLCTEKLDLLEILVNSDV